MELWRNVENSLVQGIARVICFFSMGLLKKI